MIEIFKIFNIYKRELIIIYLFMFLTELSILFQPFLLGKAIDNLILGSWFWILLLTLSYLLSNLFNYKRMVYDTKVYSKIYNYIVLNFLKTTKSDTSTKVARTDMAYDIVNVLEGYVHYYISTIITIIGTIGFIFYNSLEIGILVSFAFIVFSFLVLIYYKKIKQSINVSNNHIENKVKYLDSGISESISFFNRKRKLDIYSSTIQGKNWFIFGLVKNIFIIFSIIFLVKTSNDITVGLIITNFTYISNFLNSLTSIPVGVETYSRLNNIIKRINLMSS